MKYQFTDMSKSLLGLVGMGMVVAVVSPAMAQYGGTAGNLFDPPRDARAIRQPATPTRSGSVMAPSHDPYDPAVWNAKQGTSQNVQTIISLRDAPADRTPPTISPSKEKSFTKGLFMKTEQRSVPIR